MTKGRRRRAGVNASSKAETSRVSLERMGIDCKLARSLSSKGIPGQHIRMLATGKASHFLIAAKGKLTAEEEKIIREKYLR